MIHHFQRYRVRSRARVSHLLDHAAHARYEFSIVPSIRQLMRHGEVVLIARGEENKDGESQGANGHRDLGGGRAGREVHRATHFAVIHLFPDGKAGPRLHGECHLAGAREVDRGTEEDTLAGRRRE